MNETTERLQKMLAHAGVASRRACELLIAAGRVAVNGKVVTELGTQVAASDQVTVDGKLIGGDAPLTYVMLNKPTGYVTTASDPEGRPTVLDLVRGPRRILRAPAVSGGVRPLAAAASAAPGAATLAEAPVARGVAARLYPVGRLDVDSEGLVLLTNDGELSLHLTHPRYEQEKEYRVLVEGAPDEKTLDRLRQGIDLDGRMTAPAKVKLLLSAPEPAAATVHGRAGRRVEALAIHAAPAAAVAPNAGVRTTWLSFVIHEGRQRQVRRMCLTVGLPVKRLVRVRMGGLCLGNLPLGQWRFLTEAEIKALKPALAPAPKPTLKPTFRPRLRPRLRSTIESMPKPAPEPILRSTLKPSASPAPEPTRMPILKPTARPTPGPMRRRPTLKPRSALTLEATVKPTPELPLKPAPKRTPGQAAPATSRFVPGKRNAGR